MIVPAGNAIVAVEVKRGDRVRKGDPLLTIQDVGLNTYDAELAELELKEARTAMQKAIDIKKIEVRWPNGQNTVQTFRDVRANYKLLIEEGKDEITYLP